jgi:hypothetical protein
VKAVLHRRRPARRVRHSVRDRFACRRLDDGNPSRTVVVVLADELEETAVWALESSAYVQPMVSAPRAEEDAAAVVILA